jgi:uncharacterized protein (DUF427 family)
MVTAEWNGNIIAQSDKTVVVEGNHYFPPEAINQEFLEKSNHQTTCIWKGQASYYHLVVDGQRNENAAWFYPEPTEAAQRIKNHLAFYGSVKVRED